MRTRRFPIIPTLVCATFFATLLPITSSEAQLYAPPQDTVLHVFQGQPSDGTLHAGGVVLDGNGNVYGATTYGGNGGSNCLGGSCGTVYELMPPSQRGVSWTERILYNFTGKNNGNDGELPNGGLIIDHEGNLYGMTAYGGTGNCVLFSLVGCGTVYELSPPESSGGSWTKTTLYSFQGGSDGYVGIGNLVFDKAGNLYGATEYGG